METIKDEKTYKREGELIEIKNEITLKLTIDEQFNDLIAVDQSIVEMEGRIKQVKDIKEKGLNNFINDKIKAIKDKYEKEINDWEERRNEETLEKDLKNAVEQKEKTEKWLESIKQTLKKEIEEYQIELKKEIKVLKAEAGYNRSSNKEPDTKFNKKSEIFQKAIQKGKFKKYSNALHKEIWENFDSI
jgi:hypothetical protein